MMLDPEKLDPGKTRKFFAPSGTVWTLDEAGLNCFKNGANTLYPPLIPTAFIRFAAFYEDRQGNLWLGANGTAVFKIKNGAVTRYGKKDGLPPAPLEQFLEERDGAIWIGTLGGGLARFDEGRFSFYTVKDGLSDNMAGHLLEDREGNLWVGTGAASVTNATPAGSYNVVIRATGSCPTLAPLDTSFTLNVNCPIVTLSIPSGTAGTPYNQAISGAPANGNYSFMQTGGTLPPGLTLQSNGLLAGTPTTAGSYSFDVSATGFGTCTKTQTLILVIQCPTITLSPASLPTAQINTPYAQTIAASPTGTTYNFAVTSGLLPAGIILNANGSFSGAPTQSGTFNFRIMASGFGSCSSFRDYILIVDCPGVTLNPATLPSGTIGTTYHQIVAASPAGSYSYSVTSGVLPPGLAPRLTSM